MRIARHLRSKYDAKWFHVHIYRGNPCRSYDKHAIALNIISFEAVSVNGWTALIQ